MIEVMKGISNLIGQFFNRAFEFKVDINGNQVSVLTLVIAFSAIVIIIYFIMRGLGFIKGDD